MDRSDSSFGSEEPNEDPEDSLGDLEGYRGEEEPEFGGSSAGITDGPIGDENLLRGWIEPDDRLWLHPSEMGRASRHDALDRSRRRARRSDRRGILAAGVVGIAALTAAGAAVALAASSRPLVTNSSLTSGSTHLTSSDTSNVSQVSAERTATASCTTTLMSLTTCHAIQRVAPSMLHVTVGSGSRAADGTAVVVASGTESIAITSASLVGTARSIRTTGPTGKTRSLKVLGVDDKTGVAVVNIPWKVPAAPTAQQAVVPGEFFLVLACDQPAANDVVQPMFGEIDPDSDTTLMDAFGVDISPVAAPGGVLLDSAGSVLGFLSVTLDENADATGEFVPSWLAIGVAKRIVADHKIVHGWLDMEGMTPAGDDGAAVVTVPAKGPAADAGLKPGDLVVGMVTASGAVHIDSMEDLRGRLYLEPPGAKVELEVLRGSEQLTLSPVLAAAYS